MSTKLEIDAEPVEAQLDDVVGGAGYDTGYFTPIGPDGRPGQRIPLQLKGLDRGPGQPNLGATVSGRVVRETDEGDLFGPSLR